MISYMILIVESAYIQYKLYILTICHLDHLKMSHVTCPFRIKSKWHLLGRIFDTIEVCTQFGIGFHGLLLWRFRHQLGGFMQRLTSRNDSLTTNKNLLAKDKRTQGW